MKLKFFGSKGEIEEFSRKHRYHSSLLIEYKKSKVLIDYGTGLPEKYNLKKIKPDAILITHAHPDHYVWTKKDVELPKNTKVYLTKESLKYGKFKPKNYKIIKPGKTFRTKDFTILPYKVLHSIRCPAIGFKITVNRKNILYTGDLVDIIGKSKILKNVDYYIGDGSCIKANLVRRHKETGKVFGHARISTQINWCEKYNIKNIIFTHLGKETIRKEKQFKKQNPEVIFAYDGMKIKL